MTKIISIFNNKGGVGKTTLTWNIGDALARKGKRTLLIDFDPQCNLSLAVLGEHTFSKKLPNKEIHCPPYGTTVRAYLQRFLQGTGGSEVFLQCGEENKTHQNVKLIAGDFWLNAYGESLSVGADLLTGTGISKYVILVNMVKEANRVNNADFDFVLIDLPPSFGTLVRAALYSSDYYIVPCTSDTFSAYCVSLIGEMLPRFMADWKTGIERFKKDNVNFTDYDRLGSPKFAGWIFNGFDTRGKDQDGEEKKIKADEVHYNRIVEAINEHLIKNEDIKSLPDMPKQGIIGETEDMNTLIQNSIWLNVPVGELEAHKPIKSLHDRGQWRENQIQQIQLLQRKFRQIADNIIRYCI